MGKKKSIGNCGDPAEDMRVIERYTEVGLHPERTVLVPSPAYIDEVNEGGKWLAAFSERSDVPAEMKELRIATIGEVLSLQDKAEAGEGIVLDPYTDPLWIPNGMIPILLDGGNRTLSPDGTWEGEES